MSEQSDAMKKHCAICGQPSVKPYLCGACDLKSDWPTPADPFGNQNGIMYALMGSSGRLEMTHREGIVVKVYAIRIGGTKVDGHEFTGKDPIGQAVRWVRREDTNDD